MFVVYINRRKLKKGEIRKREKERERDLLQKKRMRLLYDSPSEPSVI